MMDYFKMNFNIYFSLIIISVIIGGMNALYTQPVLDKIIREGKSITDSKEHDLKVVKKVAETLHSMVLKGIYNKNQTVAIKVFLNQQSMEREVAILQALRAMKEVNIEDRGIPRVYFFGKITGDYNAIAMTLFDESLEKRYELQGKKISDLSILLIFRQAVEALQYLNRKKILHNDIKPTNLFLLGSRVFINDFDLGTLNGDQNKAHTSKFASMSFHEGRERSAMDDFQSLVFTIWHVAGIELGGSSDGSGEPEGLVLSEKEKIGEAESRVKEKCAHFHNEIVREAFESICIGEMLAKKPAPDYELIYDKLTETIDKINDSERPANFEWLTGAKPWSLKRLLTMDNKSK